MKLKNYSACDFCEYNGKNGCILEMPAPITSCYTPIVLWGIKQKMLEEMRENNTIDLPSGQNSLFQYIPPTKRKIWNKKKGD